MKFTIYHNKEEISNKEIEKLKFILNEEKEKFSIDYNIKLKYNNKILICEQKYKDNDFDFSEYNSNQIAITYINGFIKNHLELRDKLPNKNWRSNRQEETINELLISFGPNHIIPELEGNYSIASINFEKKDIFVFSDKLRTKEIYIFNKTQHQKTIISTSILHIRNLLEEKDLIIDKIAKTQFFTLGYINKPRTIFKNIRGLNGKEFIRFNFKENKVSSFPAQTFQGIYENISLEDLLIKTIKKELNVNKVNNILFSYEPISELLIKIIDKEFGYKINCLFQNKYQEEENIKEEIFNISNKRSQTKKYNLFLSDNLYDFISNITSYTQEPFANTELIFSNEFKRLLYQDNIFSFISTLGYSEIFWGHNKQINAIKKNKLIINNISNQKRYKNYFNLYSNKLGLENIFNFKKYDFYKDLDIRYFKNINPLSIIQSDINSTLISNLLNLDNKGLFFKTPINKKIFLNKDIINWTEYLYSGISSKNFKEIKNPFDEIFRKYNVNVSNYPTRKINQIPSWLTNDRTLRNILIKDLKSNFELLPAFYKKQFRDKYKLENLSELEFNILFKEIWLCYCWTSFMKSF